MYKYIKTSRGEIKYTPTHFKVGTKIIDIEKSKDNLLSFKRVMDKNNLKFGLIYGTLLGAIRENNFISHDEDTDVYILDEDREELLDTLHDLISSGFTVGRYVDNLISIVRDGEYIDIYIFSKHHFGYRICNGEIIKERYLTKTIKYNFLNSYFNIPKDYEECLVYLYGKDWKTPIKDYHPANYPFLTQIKYKLVDRFPSTYKFIKQILKGV